MKKFFAVLISLVLVLSMGTAAFAADGTAATTGTITISNALEGATYNIYKMFDFTPVEGSTTQGRYTMIPEWSAFIAEGGAGAAYLKANAETGTIEWVGEESDERKAELAKAAVAYAKENAIEAAAPAQTAAADGAVSFENLTLGYYAIDSSLGAVCGLTNVNTTFELHEKNTKPDLTKEVKEDSTEAWGDKNDADIDQVVEFKATITTGAGSENYIMHDTMSEGLTFDAASVVVTNITDSYTLAAGTDYELKTVCADGCTFEIDFTDSYEATLGEKETIEVTYSATLNENAVIAGDGNPNEAKISYGDESKLESIPSKTITYTWKMDVFKWTDVEGAETPLSGATFELRKVADDETTAIKFVEVTEVNGEAVTMPTYKVDSEGTVTAITTKENGKFELIGLDEGTYYLVETEAPAGYNKLSGPVTVTITSNRDAATWVVNPSDDGLTVEVENKTGSLLPETGGMGTKIFYVVGIALMLGAVILLITKKRMTAKAE